MENSLQSRQYISAKDLQRKRRWSIILIDKFLGKPDLVKGLSEKLYSLDKVRLAESHESFQFAKVRRNLNHYNQKDLAEYVRGLKIEVPEMDDYTLIKKACENYNKIHDVKNGKRPAASLSSHYQFICRITMNYLRHEMTMYEEMLVSMAGGKNEPMRHHGAAALLKKRINEAILAKYPFLNTNIDDKNG